MTGPEKPAGTALGMPTLTGPGMPTLTGSGIPKLTGSAEGYLAHEDLSHSMQKLLYLPVIIFYTLVFWFCF